MNSPHQDNYLSEIKSAVAKASSTTDRKVLTELANHINITVRRAVARNIYTPSDVLHILAHDVAVNVSAMAIKNKNCYIKREIPKDSLSRRCVACEVQEIDTFEKCPQC